MAADLRISVADDEFDRREYYQCVLPHLGHQVVSRASNGRQLVADCAQYRPDLVITDIKMPELDGLQAAALIYEQHPVPIVLVSAYHTPEMLERAGSDHVLSYLVKPIQAADLQPAIAIARRRFEEFQALRQEVTDLRHGLQERHLIEVAKGILMRRRNQHA